MDTKAEELALPTGETESEQDGRPIHSGVPDWCGGSGSDLPFDPFNPPDPLE